MSTDNPQRPANSNRALRGAQSPGLRSGLIAACGAGLAIAWLDLLMSLAGLATGLGRNVLDLLQPLVLAAVVVSSVLAILAAVPVFRFAAPVWFLTTFLVAAASEKAAVFAYPDRLHTLAAAPKALLAIVVAIVMGGAAAAVTTAGWRHELLRGARQKQLWCVLPAALVLVCAWLWTLRRPWCTHLETITATGCAVAVLLLWRKAGPDRRRRLAPFLLAATWIGTVTLTVVSVALIPRSGPEPPRPIASEGPQTVVLVTIDTLRADAAVNHAGPPTPALDRLAASSVVFEAAVAPAPWTLPSLVSVLTGLSPAAHRATSFQDSLSTKVPNLAERLAEHGFRTAVIGRSPFLHPGYQLDRSFAERQCFPRQWPAKSFSTALADRLLPNGDADTAELAQRACTWLERQGDAPVFLWLHLYDPHQPYQPPDRFQPSGEPASRIGRSFARFGEVRAGSWVPSAAEKEWVRQLYNGEVRFVDEAVGTLIDTLERLHRLSDALVIVTSDHGEELWEHGGYEHGHSLYQEVIAVPLIVKPPQSTQTTTPRTVTEPVTITAIAATILDLCGISVGPYELSADSLVASWTDPTTWNPGIVTSRSLLYYSQREAAIAGGYKLIRDLDGERSELYDLACDPAERDSIHSDEPDRLAELTELFDQEAAQAARLREHYGLEEEDGWAVRSAERLRLEALGYLAP